VSGDIGNLPIVHRFLAVAALLSTLFQEFGNVFRPDRSLTVAALIEAAPSRGGSPNT
jgi:hypothetical protein